MYTAFRADRWRLAAASADGRARLRDPADRECLRILDGRPIGFTGFQFLGVAFTPDRRLLATASADETARLWA